MTGSPACGAARVLLPAVAALALLLGGAGTALAHDEVVATTPADGADVPAPPSVVELQMFSPPQVLGTEVQVTGPGGAGVSEGPAEVLGDRVTQPVADDLAAGAYTVEYRVTSGDGHPISGSFGFTVAEGAPSSVPQSAAGPSSEAAPDGPSDAPGASPSVDEAAANRPAGSSSSTGQLVGGALVVLVLAGLVTWRLRRRA